jgi:hypothetical protein
VRRRLLPSAALAIFLLPLLPEIVGAKLLVFRDAFVTHLPIKLAALEMLRNGSVPFLNWGASNVEPLLPNPNTFSLYPTNLLYFLLPRAAAFNLHLLLHVPWAFFGAAALARRIGASPRRCALAGAGYAFSGPFLSYAAAFSNSVAAAAWAPWAIAEVVALASASRARTAVRAAAGAAIAFALQLLAGEPAISVWTAVFAAVLALPAAARNPARFAGRAAPAALLSAALAAPLWIATAAAVPESFRGRHAFSRGQFDATAIVPARLLEWLFPLVYGSPRPIVSGAFWGYRVIHSMQPYLYSFNVGLPILALALAGLASPEVRRRRGVIVLGAVAAVSLWLSLGFRAGLAEILWAIAPLRHFRYPSKFALPFALALAVLAALAADGLAQKRGSRLLPALTAVASLLLLAGGLAALLARSGLTSAVAPAFVDMRLTPSQVMPGIFRIVLIDAAAGVAAMAILALARGHAGAQLAAVLLALLPTGWMLFVSTPSGPYLAAPPLARDIAGAGRVHVGRVEEFPIVLAGSRHAYEKDEIAEVVRAARNEIWPLTALPEGVEYAYDEDPDGSYGFYDRTLREAIAVSDPDGRSHLLRGSAVRFDLSPDRQPPAGFHLRGHQWTAGRDLYLSEADSPVPLVRAATRIFRRNSVSGAIELMRSPVFDPARDAVAAGDDADPLRAGEGAVSGESRSETGLAAEIVSTRGVEAVFAVTFFRFWRATVDDVAANVALVNGNFCGVSVPPGRHRVALRYDARPFIAGALAAAVSAAALLAAGLWLLAERRRDGPAAAG